MKAAAAFLSMLLVLPAFGQDASSSSVTAAMSELPPFVVTAPPVREEQERRLKTARAAGGVTAVGGAGLMTYAVFAGAGPVGWAAALLFFGGVTAYLSHRRLKGADDFGPTNTPATKKTAGVPDGSPAGS